MFGRRRKAQPEPQTSARSKSSEGDPGEPPDQELSTGPYDVSEVPDDGRKRLDLGSVRLPVPEGAQLQVEVDNKSGQVRAVHLMTKLGQLTVTAFAAPRSGGLWPEVLKELVGRLREDGAPVTRSAGEWGTELEAVTPQGVLRFLGVDGPRWMLRAVAAGTTEHAQQRAALLRDVVRHCVVVRGSEPLPVRSQLPIRLPAPLAEQLKQAARAAQQGTVSSASSASSASSGPGSQATAGPN